MSHVHTHTLARPLWLNHMSLLTIQRNNNSGGDDNSSKKGNHFVSQHKEKSPSARFWLLVQRHIFMMRFWMRGIIPLFTAIILLMFILILIFLSATVCGKWWLRRGIRHRLHRIFVLAHYLQIEHFVLLFQMFILGAHSEGKERSGRRRTIVSVSVCANVFAR